MKLIGNEDFVKIVELAKNRLPFPHSLLYGPSGSGKTTLAKFIANSTHQEINIYYAPEIDPVLLTMMIRNVEKNNIIIIDEIHALNQKMMEQIYQPIEEGIFQGIPLDPFTLIGVTTDLNKLPDALIRRFRLVYRVSLYSVEELSQVIHGLSKKDISGDAVESIAMFSRGSPGVARNHIELIEIMFGNNIDVEEIEEYQKLKHIDNLGLEDIDREYLKAVNNFGVLALSTLSSVLSEREKTIEEIIEPFLFRSGLAIKTSKGRILTPKGKGYIR